MKNAKRLLALLLGLGISLAPTTAHAVEAQSSKTVSTSQEDTEFSEAEVKELEQYLKTLFRQVVIKDELGRLRIDHEAARRLYPDQDLSLLSTPSSHTQTPKRATSPLGLQEYAWCVVKGAIPFIGLIDVDWNLIRMWVGQQNWGALSRYLGKEVPKRAAKVGIKDALKLTPWGIAASIAASAVTCAVWQNW